MAFTLHIDLTDFGLKPVPGVRFELLPAMREVLKHGGHVLTDRSEAATNARGYCEISAESSPGTLWWLHSTGRFDMYFRDPGDGVVVNALDLIAVDPDGDALTPDDPESLSAVEQETLRALAAESALGRRIDQGLGSANNDALAVVTSEIERAQAAEAALRSEMSASIEAHRVSATPHPAYDDIPDLTLLFRAATI